MPDHLTRSICGGLALPPRQATPPEKASTVPPPGTSHVIAIAAGVAGAADALRALGRAVVVGGR